MEESLYDLAVFGDFEGVQRLVEKKPEIVNQTDEYGFTALHGLAEEEYPNIIKYLLQNGADINAKNDEGITPLHLAGWPKIAALFIKHGADLEAKSSHDETPLLVLAAEPETEDAIKVLLKAGANVNAMAKNGKTALDIALSRNEPKKVKLLKKFGAQKGAS